MKPLDFKTLQGTEPVRRRPLWLSTLRGLLMVALPVALLGGAAYGYKYMRDNRPPIPQRPAFERAFAVQAVRIAYSDFQPVLKLYGETVAGRKVEMKSLVPGEIVNVGEALREGARVGRGDMLIAIDRFDYEGAVAEADANLREAQARLAESIARIAQEEDALKRAAEQLELARRDLERADKLLITRALSEKGVDDRRMVVSTREQALEQRQTNLMIEKARADQQRAAIARLEWKLRQARRNLDNTLLKAPFDAYVSNVNAEVGRMLGANDTVATLIDSDWLEVRVTLSDQQYGRILRDGSGVVGRPVTIRWKVGAAPIELNGAIDRVGAQIDAQTGGVEVYARADLGDRAGPLRAGAFVEVELADRAYANVARLPESALYGTDTVYIIDDADERLTRRAVELIGYDGAHILVRGDLRENERVITTRISEVGEGILVQEQQ